MLETQIPMSSAHMVRLDYYNHTIFEFTTEDWLAVSWLFVPVLLGDVLVAYFGGPDQVLALYGLRTSTSVLIQASRAADWNRSGCL